MSYDIKMIRQMIKEESAFVDGLMNEVSKVIV